MLEQGEVSVRKVRRVHLDHVLIFIGALGVVAALMAALWTKV
jgi:hypothetical protein